MHVLCKHGFFIVQLLNCFVWLCGHACMHACFPGTESRACGIVAAKRDLTHVYLFHRMILFLRDTRNLVPPQLKIGLSIIKLIRAHFNCTRHLFMLLLENPRKLLSYIGPFLGQRSHTRTEVTIPAGPCRGKKHVKSFWNHYTIPHTNQF